MANRIIIFPLTLIIKIYQYFVSPLFGQSCRYLPTCSEYALESLKLHGLIKGSFLAIKRISKCHPFSNQGVDPVPKNDKLL